MPNARIIRLILGDQLNRRHSWFSKVDKDVLYVFMEVKQETGYVRHHIQKVIGFFLAMRCFAEELQEAGHRVHYLRLDEPGNQQNIPDNIRSLVEATGATRFEYQLPDEYRLDQQLKTLCEDLNIETKAFDTEHFYTSRDELARFFKGKKTYLLESFYRHMRKKHRVLMEENGVDPLTGKWNYDQQNRNKFPKKEKVPEHLGFARPVTELVDLLEAMQLDTIGTVDPEAFTWPVSRKESLQLLDHFLEDKLRRFGTYQDAMTGRDKFLYHSRLSFALNTKMLSPGEVVDKCEAHWRRHRDEVDIAQAEGFIRQILGWREYMRGIYWAKMPDFAQLNYFGHDRSLPGFYWTGDTKMKCLQHAVGQSLEYAYAHHIQRLMVTGNFALLLGCHPDEVDAWYLGIYIDAVEWVEITNTRGMSQFADGGIVGTKPYVSSANYIHKMSDHCSQCYYDKKDKHGARACPFNSLYWDFYERHRDKLASNPRIGMMYRLLDKMDRGEVEKLLERASWIKEHVDEI